MISPLPPAAFAAAQPPGDFQHPHLSEPAGHPFVTCPPRKRSTPAMRAALDEVERLHRGEL